MVRSGVEVDLGRLGRGLAEPVLEFGQGGSRLGRESHARVPEIMGRTSGRPIRFRARRSIF